MFIGIKNKGVVVLSKIDYDILVNFVETASSELSIIKDHLDWVNLEIKEIEKFEKAAKKVVEKGV